MRDPLRLFKVGRAIRDNQIFGGDKQGHLAVKVGIVIHFFERVARHAQPPQHTFMLGAVFGHDIHKLVIHVLLHTGRRFFFPGGLLAYNLCLDRAGGGERALHGFRLELDQSLAQERVVYAASTFPRFRPLLDFHAQQLYAVHINLQPVPAGVQVGFKIFQQSGSQRLHLRLKHVLRQIGKKFPRGFGFVGHQVDLHPAHMQSHGVRVFHLHLNVGGGRAGHPLRGLV